LALETVEEIVSLPNYPSYADWKTIAETPKRERMYAVATIYARMGEHSAASSLKRRLVFQDAHDIYERKLAGGFEASLTDCAAEILVERNDHEGAIAIYEAAIGREPENFWLWHGMCRVYTELYGIEKTIVMCRAAVFDNFDNAKNLPCLAELGCLYAIAGYYEKSVAAFELFWEHCKYISQKDDLRNIVLAKLHLDIPETRYLPRRY
jgi:tetratricopeptide (TPR) repeat protein